MIACECIADKGKAMLEDLKTDSEIWEAERQHSTHGDAFIKLVNQWCAS